jgi:hypothetical protein
MNSLADAVRATGTLGVVGVFIPKNLDAEDGRAGSAVVDGIARTNSALHGTARVRMKLMATHQGYSTSHGLVQVWGRKLLACTGD